MGRHWVVLVTALSLSGCGGEAAGPSVSAISPARIFSGRTVDVLISGDDTSFDDATTVDFGPGLTVEAVRAASPTGLIVTLTSAPDAAPGPRDVVVTDGGRTHAFKGGFSIAPPIEVTTVGTLAQGSVVRLDIVNRDLDNLFDTTATGDGFFTRREFTHIAIARPSGTTLTLDEVTPFRLRATLSIDVKAPAGVSDLVVHSGPSDRPVVFTAPGFFDVKAREPEPVAPGATEATLAAGETKLYQVTVGPNQVNLFGVAPGLMTADPRLVLLRASGRFASSVGATHLVTGPSGGGTYYAVVFDAGGAAYDLVFVQRQVTLAATATAATDNTDAAAAQALPALPALVTGATFAAATDAHWFKLTAGAGDAGKKVRVTTLPGDLLTDTVVDVLASDGTTSLGGPSGDTSFHEDFLSSAIPAAGDVFVKVTFSDESALGSSNGAYQLLVHLE